MFKIIGKKVPWILIFNIGKSFNISMEISGFEEINKVCPEALDYCLNSDPKLWRCTEYRMDKKYITSTKV